MTITTERLIEKKDRSGETHDFSGDEGCSSHEPKRCRACRLATAEAALAAIREAAGRGLRPAKDVALRVMTHAAMRLPDHGTAEIQHDREIMAARQVAEMAEVTHKFHFQRSRVEEAHKAFHEIADALGRDAPRHDPEHDNDPAWQMRAVAEHFKKKLAVADAETEQLRVQLAGCSVAAQGNTRAAAAGRAKQGAYGWSASYLDVCHAVDREMAERERADRAEAERAAAQKNALAFGPALTLERETRERAEARLSKAEAERDALRVERDEARAGPALCVYCGTTIAEAGYDVATAIKASKQHVLNCDKAPWRSLIAAATARADKLGEALRSVRGPMDRARNDFALSLPGSSGEITCTNALARIDAALKPPEGAALAAVPRPEGGCVCGKTGPNIMDAPDGPRCHCGKPSVRESGDCETCGSASAGSESGPEETPMRSILGTCRLTKVPHNAIRCAEEHHEFVTPPRDQGGDAAAPESVSGSRLPRQNDPTRSSGASVTAGAGSEAGAAPPRSAESEISAFEFHRLTLREALGRVADRHNIIWTPERAAEWAQTALSKDSAFQAEHPYRRSQKRQLYVPAGEEDAPPRTLIDCRCGAAKIDPSKTTPTPDGHGINHCPGQAAPPRSELIAALEAEGPDADHGLIHKLQRSAEPAATAALEWVEADDGLACILQNGYELAAHTGSDPPGHFGIAVYGPTLAAAKAECERISRDAKLLPQASPAEPTAAPGCDCGRPPVKHLYDASTCLAPPVVKDASGQYVTGSPPDGRSVDEHLTELVAAADCAHEDFETGAAINRLVDTGSFVVDFKVKCRRCGEAFRFLKLPPGISTTSPCVNLDGTCASLPIEPEGQKRLFARMQIEMPNLPEKV